MSALILGASAILQCLAAYLSLRLIKITGRWEAWSFIAFAMVLMGIIRFIKIFQMLTSDVSLPLNLTSDLIAFSISALMVAGVMYIGPLFEKITVMNQALQRREEQLADAQRVAKLGIFEIDFSDGSVCWSDEIYVRYGYDKNKYVPRFDRFFDDLHEADRDRVREAIESFRHSDSEELMEIEYCMTPENGEEYHIYNVFTPIKDKSGKTIRCRCVSLDITEHRRSQQALRISEEKLTVVFNTSPESTVISRQDNGQILFVNPAFTKLTQFSEAEAKGKTLRDLNLWVRQEDRDVLIRKLEEDGAVNDFQTEFYNKTKAAVPVTLSASRIELEGKQCIVTMSHDITGRRLAEEELRKLSRAVEAGSSGVIIIDLKGNMEYVNPKFTEITGFTKAEALGQNIHLLRSGETPESTFIELWEKVKAGGTWKGELRDRKKDGTLYWDRISMTGIKNAQGEITHFVAIQEDVTHEYELSEQLSYQASHDALTGLVNRREFERRAERLLLTVRQDNTEHALCYMDLDQFKIVNDTCGHIAGDEMLRQLSTVLQGVVRKRDTLARLGGDEFGVLMEHCSPDHSHRVASTLQKTIHDYQFSWEGYVFKVGVSIGLVAITETFSSLTELLKQADAACYMAKDLGRNRIQVYHEEDVSLAKRHGEMQWVTRIYQALEEDRFCLYAQTIVCLESQFDKHYELLIRMKDEVGQLIPPGAFLPAAERYNLIDRLDAWVIEKAFTLLAANPVFLEQVHFISINLSGQSLTKHKFLDFIITHLEKFEIPGNKICFEITETTAISNLSIASNFIATLKDLGCQFALDDFGSGLSSFGYLKNLAVNYLKIDGMFVKDIVDDPIDRAMVKSINEIGHVMGMQTIAEFVENDEIKGMLREIGVDYAQGYGIGKPELFEDLLGRPVNDNVIKITQAHNDKS